MDNWYEVCEIDDLEDGEIQDFTVNGIPIVLILDEDTVYAAQGICPHMEEKLSNGIFRRCRLICTKHLWQWDITNGAPLDNAEVPLSVYPTKIDDSRVLVQLQL